MLPRSALCQSGAGLQEAGRCGIFCFFDRPQGKTEMNKSLVIATLIAAAALAACGKKEEPAPAPAPAPVAVEPAAPAAPASEAAAAATDAASAAAVDAGAAAQAATDAAAAGGAGGRSRGAPALAHAAREAGALEELGALQVGLDIIDPTGRPIIDGHILIVILSILKHSQGELLQIAPLGSAVQSKDSMSLSSFSSSPRPPRVYPCSFPCRKIFCSAPPR